MLARLAVDGPHEQLTESSLRDAETCCLCRDCGDVIVNGWDCAVCSRWRWFTRLWVDIGTALTWGIKTEVEWRAAFSDEEAD